MTHRVLNRVCQAAINKPNAATAYDFSTAASFPPFFTFNSRSIATGDTLGYEVMNEAGDYERGLGTWNNTAKTLTRTTIRESTNANAAVDWSGSASAVTVISDGRQEEDLIYGASNTEVIILGSILFKSVSVTGLGFTPRVIRGYFIAAGATYQGAASFTVCSDWPSIINNISHNNTEVSFGGIAFFGTTSAVSVSVIIDNLVSGGFTINFSTVGDTLDIESGYSDVYLFWEAIP